MKYKILSVLAGLLIATVSIAGPFVPNQVLTAAELNAALANAGITSGTIAGVTQTGGTIDGANIGSNIPASGVFTKIGGVQTLYLNIAPTIASGFGSSAVIATSNGSSSFHINVGTVSVAASGIINMPTGAGAPPNGWDCDVSPVSSVMPQSNVVAQAYPLNASQVSITNYQISSASAVVWLSSEILAVRCSGY